MKITGTITSDGLVDPQRVTDLERRLDAAEMLAAAQDTRLAQLEDRIAALEALPTPDPEPQPEPEPPGPSLVELIAADTFGRHDAVPRGVPAGYSWRESADTDPARDSTWGTNTAINVWGQCFATDTTTTFDVRLQARRPRAWFLVDGAWIEADVTAGPMGGAYYSGDYQSGSASGDVRDAKGDVWSAPLSPLAAGTQDAWHWWWDGMYPRIPIPASARGILVCQDMRLYGDVDDGAIFVANTCADLFATPRTTVHPQGWNPGIPQSRMVRLTDRWRTCWGTTVSLETLTAHPPQIGA